MLINERCQDYKMAGHIFLITEDRVELVENFENQIMLKYANLDNEITSSLAADFIMTIFKLLHRYEEDEDSV